MAEDRLIPLKGYINSFISLTALTYYSSFCSNFCMMVLISESFNLPFSSITAYSKEVNLSSKDFKFNLSTSYYVIGLLSARCLL